MLNSNKPDGLREYIASLSKDDLRGVLHQAINNGGVIRFNKKDVNAEWVDIVHARPKDERAELMAFVNETMQAGFKRRCKEDEKPPIIPQKSGATNFDVQNLSNNALTLATQGLETARKYVSGSAISVARSTIVKSAADWLWR